jgi:hypothetical protein
MNGFYSDWFQNLEAKKPTSNVVEMPHIAIAGEIAFNDEAADFRLEFKPGQSFTFKKK